MRKLNRMLVIAGMVAAMGFGTNNLLAQNNNGGGGRQGRFGRGNFDPAQFQQRIMENIRAELNFTNDTDWNAVQPLIQKVMDARRDVRAPGMGRMMFRRNNNNQDRPRRRGGFFGEPSPQEQALQQAIDNNAPTAQIKAALEKYQASQNEKEAKLKEAQENLRKVLTVKQEAQATLMGLLQ